VGQNDIQIYHAAYIYWFGAYNFSIQIYEPDLKTLRPFAYYFYLV